MSDNENTVKEIDLYRVIKNALNFFLKNKIVLLSLFFIGVLLAVIQIVNTPEKYNNYYESNFLVQSSIISDEVLFTMIENLSFNYENLDEKKFDAEVLSSIKKIDPVKELSIDGLRSDIRVIVQMSKKQDIIHLTNLVKTQIESTEYYKTRFKIKNKQYEQVLTLIDKQLHFLKIDIDDKDLASSLYNRTKEEPEQFLTYVELVEKKQQLELDIGLLNKSLEFIASEPVNELNKPINLMVLIILSYSFLLSIIGAIIIVIFNSIKRMAVK